MPEIRRVQAVILDWAGTTVDYGCLAPVMAFVRAFGEERVEVSREQVRAAMGLMKIDHLRRLCESREVRLAWLERHGREPRETDVERLYGRVEPLLEEAVREHCRPIPGVLDLVSALRRQGVRIGSTTGYTRRIMQVLEPEAARLGYAPEVVICSDEVPAGRPYPWMCYLNAMRLGAYPMAHMIKIGDTVADVQEGRNAGMWTIAFSRCGNEIGLAEEQLLSIEQGELKRRARLATRRLEAVGADYVVEGPWECLAVIEEVDRRIAAGQYP